MRVDISLRGPLRKWSRRAGRCDSVIGLICGGNDVRSADEPCRSIAGSPNWLRGKLKAFSEVIDGTPLEALARGVRSGETGRKPYEPLAMLKALYLASLYDLSDPGLEEALIDRASFRLFCGFALDQATPDETTLCRFRNDCAAAGVLEAAFAEVNRQLDAKKLIVRKGTLLDATIVTAASRRPELEAGSKPALPQE